MQAETVNRLKAWFDTYTRTFLSGDPDKDSPLLLKIEHTARVRENIRQLAYSLSLNESDVRLAEVAGLFHDIGRFRQYACYGTFNDGRSVNHASLGVDVLIRAGVLSSLPDHEKNPIMDAIRFHNAPALPEDDHLSESMIFMRLIRDADKLDIWKVFAEYYGRDTAGNSTIVQHMVDRPTWQRSIVDAIMQKRPAQFSHMKTLNDFKLIQLSWVFGLHFAESVGQARQRGHLAAIAKTLPADETIEKAVSMVMATLAAAPIV